MRLTNAMRAEIVRRILIDTFKERHEILRKRLNAFIDRVYRKQFDAQIQLANGVPKDMAETMFKKWDGSINLFLNGTELAFISNVGSSYTNDRAYTTYPYAFGELRNRYEKQMDVTLLKHGAALSAEASELNTAVEQFNDAHDALKAQIQGILAACTTDKKVLEFLPEAEPYLPKDNVAGNKALVSIDTLNSVRAVLQQNAAAKV